MKLKKNTKKTKKMEEEEEGKDKYPFYYVREMVLEDIDEVLAMHKDLFPVKYNSSFVQILATSDHIFSLIVEERKSKKERRIIGFVFVRFSWNSLFSTKRTGYIVTFGVSKDCQRNHFGSDIFQMMYRIMVHYYDIDVVKLHMQKVNTAAKQFYLKNGWNIIDMLPNYYHFEDPNENPDAFQMQINISKDFIPHYQHEYKFSDDMMKKLTTKQNLSWFQSFITDK